MRDPRRAPDPIPPRGAQRLLELALPERDRATIPGDLSEEFTQRAANEGRRLARRWYRLQVLRAIPSALRRRWIDDRAPPPSADPGRTGRVLISWIDVKLGARMLRKHPGLSLATVVALAIGIPVGVAPGHAARAVEREPPLDDVDRIQVLRHIGVDRAVVRPTSLFDVHLWQDQLTSFEVLAAAADASFNVVQDDGSAAPVEGAEVTSSWFELLRVSPYRGRTIGPDDLRAEAPAVAVIGFDLWTARFGSDPSVLGRTIRIGGVGHTIVGVMPEGFIYPWNDQLWVPLRDRALLDTHDGDAPKLRAYGRLRDGVSAEEAEVELLEVGRRMAAASPELHGLLRPQVVPFTIGTNDIPKGGLRAIPQFYLVQALAILLLGFPCANIGMLVLARTASRSGELAVRTALGASRARVVLQLFVESLLPAMAAAGLGLLGLAWLEGRRGSVDTNVIDMGLTLRTALWALGLAVFSAVVAGVLPALRATGKEVRRNIQRADAGRSGLRFGGLSGALIVADVALTVAVLVAAAGVWGSSRGGGLGLDASEILAVELRVPGSPDRVRATQTALLERLAAEAGIRGVAVASSLPGMDHDSDVIEVDEAGTTTAVGAHRVRVSRVDPGFFDALSQPILSGRAFDRTDLGSDPSVVIVNTSFVDQVLGGRNAIGRRLRYRARRDEEPGRWFEIVGVVGHLGMFGDNSQWDAGFYHPLGPGELDPLPLGIVVGDDPLAFTPRLRALAAEIDPTAVVATPMALDGVYSFLTASGKTAKLALAVVLGVFILISTLAIYALMSFSVAQRTREMAVRVALGARWDRIVVAVARRAAVQLTLGGAIGMGVGFVILSMLQIQFGPVVGGSPVGLAITVGVAGVILVASLACIAPTRRALGIAPREALSEGG